MYHLVHEVSFLDWGLTSEWALSADSTAGGRSRTRQHVQQQQQQAQPGAQLFPRRVGGDAGNAASEGVWAMRGAVCAHCQCACGSLHSDVSVCVPGYGEVTEGSLQHVLNYLAELRLRALDAPGDKGRAGVLSHADCCFHLYPDTRAANRAPLRCLPAHVSRRKTHSRARHGT